MVTILETGFVFLVLGIVSFWSYKKKFLDNEGILVANIVGLSVFFWGGFNGFLTLIVFFGVAELATLFLTGKKAKEAHARRNTGNIFGNALPAVVALILNSPLGFFGAISASLADTLSSEIGILSKEKPFLITTLKPVEYGTDGGVSLLGLLATVGGSLVMGVLHFVFFADTALAFIVFLAGIFGSLLDSVLGATVQKRRWIDNNEVNFASSGIAALVAALAAMYLGLT